MDKQQKQLNRRAFIKQAAEGAALIAAASAFPTIVPASVFGKNAPSNRIQIGQIGFGRIAKSHDLPEILKHDYVRVVAVADVDSNRLAAGKHWLEQQQAEKNGGISPVDVKTYGDYRDLIRDKAVDAVVISTPDHWHAQPAMEAAIAGKHIYMQKPTSLTIKEGRMMADVVSNRGVIFQLGSQQRSVNPWPQFKRACELVRNGRIGTVKRVVIGLPGDPAGGNPIEMPVPKNLDYDRWLGSTPYVPYTLDRVHSQTDIYERPGWLRCEQFGAGMITGWGSHHIDIAHWGLDTELTGPLEAEGRASFPTSGLWNVHGDFEVEMLYPGNVVMQISGAHPNGVRFEGTEGWIFVSRGNVGVTATDPGADGAENEAFKASDSNLLKSVIGENEVRLYESPEQHTNWLECIREDRQPISHVEIAHRSGSACLIAHAAMTLGRRLHWDASREIFTDDDEANKLLSRPQRFPYGTAYVTEKNDKQNNK